MFKRPSARRKGKNREIVLNLVPILDAMVTLIAFLLFTMAFVALVSTESPFPQTSREDVQQKLKERPLQLTVSLREKETRIWSPFEKIKTHVVPNTTASTGENVPDYKSIHETLIEIKKQFPNENKIVLVPFAAAPYEILIGIMDAMRVLEQTDPPLFRKNPATGNDEPMKALFPDVVFGNLLGDG
ncbi:MAG: hypothetical protein A2583_03480 [Bdellovibrionales bacterium RIFOXYD1_FULL_53_11]|nr:MAG: hypothetical protein A2583_03480 [Bdellovibrionales bacterium RIFOXYD1_FULL_53_11]